MSLENGGILLDYKYSGINPGNQEDAIYLKNVASVIDSVYYNQTFNSVIGASFRVSGRLR